MCGDLTTQLGLIKDSKSGLRLRPETKLVQCFFDQHYHENKEQNSLKRITNENKYKYWLRAVV